jgi:hypothetical protein
VKSACDTSAACEQETSIARLLDDSGCLVQSSFEVLLGWTVPRSKGVREDCLLNLARQLKSLPETRSMRADMLKPVFHRWWELAVPFVRTKDYFVNWGGFTRALERAIPFGGTALTEIIDAARRAGCPDELRAEFGSHICGLLAAICRELAIRGGGVFWLAQRPVARHLGLSHTTVGDYLNALIGSRVIRKIEEPVHRKTATVYCYLRQLPSDE